MSTLIPNVMEFIGAGAAVKVKWDPKEAKLVDSEDREMSLLEAIPVLKDSCTHKELFGETPEEEAKIYQCVEWALRFGPDLQDEQTSSAAALKELNAILENRVYLTGHRFTLADVVMLHAVHGIVSKLSYFEKERYIHVSRWYNLIQHTPAKIKLTKVKFSCVKLY